MSNQTALNNKRIAKNTILLYFRTIFIMLITLYTSRVILNYIGIEDYGIYNVVGGVVTMFSIISGAQTASVSRYLTFELGRGDSIQLSNIFSMSINIQIGMVILVLLISEPVGIWFINTHLNIPPDRLIAAHWVFQCSLLTFCINLLSIPYNALIVAHEKMSVFAYVSILEASLKLSVVYLLLITPGDRLIAYAVLLLIVALIIRLTYGIYCGKVFSESKYKYFFDKSLFKEMTGFAGLSFFTNCSYVFNTQGCNMLINMFYGVSLNAARGIASQVNSAILQFVNNFTTALNPQITKLYAQGEKREMFNLICRGTKFSFFLLMIFSLPVIFETDIILEIWLKNPPEYSALFLRLTILASMIQMLGNTGYTACMATGNIKKYVIWITSIGSLVFPITWIVYYLGGAPESTYWVFIFIYALVDIVRLWIMKGLLEFPPSMFFKDVILYIFKTFGIAVILPIIIIYVMEPTIVRLIISIIVCIICSMLSIVIVGLKKNERKIIVEQLLKLKAKYPRMRQLN